MNTDQPAASTGAGFDVHVERLVDATPEEAFDAWVDAAARAEWYAPDPSWAEAEVDSDLRVGGRWRTRFGPAPDRAYTEEGQYVEVDRPNRLVYTCRFSARGEIAHETVVTVVFTAQDGKTLVVVDDRGFPTAAQRDVHQNGWPGFLAAYERVLTGRRTA